MTPSTPDKSLFRFLETVYSNQKANCVRFPGEYRIIKRIDDCFVKAARHLHNEKPVFAGPMFLRSQYAYKTAAGMTLAGQVTESFVMMRSCLEYAGYGLAIFADAPNREEVFVNRHVNEASQKAQRDEFQIAKIRVIMKKYDQALTETFKSLYDRTIDYGGHPNPYGMLSAMNLEKKGDRLTEITTLALTIEPLPLIFAMKSVAQVGLTALYVFQHIFKAKFELLGIRAEMDALRNEGV